MNVILSHIRLSSGTKAVAANRAIAMAVMNGLFFPIFCLFMFVIGPIYFGDTIYRFIL